MGLGLSRYVGNWKQYHHSIQAQVLRIVLPCRCSLCKGECIITHLVPYHLCIPLKETGLLKRVKDTLQEMGISFYVGIITIEHYTMNVHFTVESYVRIVANVTELDKVLLENERKNIWMLPSYETVKEKKQHATND